jgi:mono/diheme cytochrome c family protein
MERPSALQAGVRLLVFAFLIALPLAAGAQEASTTDTVDPAATEQLQRGADVFSANCQACHQAGGVGIEGTFPPLADNPNVADAAYVAETVTNGRQGALEVLGVTYDGVMPAFSTLSDEDVAAVTAYIQAGFVIPGGVTEPADALPVATGALPELSSMAMVAAFALAAVAALFVLAPRIVTAVNRRELPWLDAWLRSGIIVIGLIVAIAIIPSAILKAELVASLPRAVQDIIGLALWGGGLAVGLLALWYAHREKRI